MAKTILQSPMADRLRQRVERRLPKRIIPNLLVRDLCYSAPAHYSILLTTRKNETVGLAEVVRGMGRDPLIKACIALMCDGTSFESWISREEPSIARLSMNAKFIGRCESCSNRETSISRPGVWNFWKGLLGFRRIWWAERYDLWCGESMFGRVQGPRVVVHDSIKIQHVSGNVLPVNMLSYTSWIRGVRGPNLIIPNDAPLLERQEDEQFYLAASIMFKMLVFEHDLSD
jgi:hypothetical protein